MGLLLRIKVRIIFTQLLVRGAAGVHKGLRHHREAAVHNVGLAQVKHKVRVLDEVNPEPRKYMHILVMFKFTYVGGSYLRGREFDFHVWTTSESVMPC